MTDDMTVDHQMRMRRLQSLELHGVTPEMRIEDVKQESSGGIIELYTFNWSAQMRATASKYLYLADGSNREIAVINRKQLDELISLLQKAREIMQNGGA